MHRVESPGDCGTSTARIVFETEDGRAMTGEVFPHVRLAPGNRRTTTLKVKVKPGWDL